jgi:hypothetical protein
MHCSNAFYMVLLSSHWVPNSTFLYPIIFAQSCPLGTYIAGPKDRPLYFYLGSEHSFLGESPKFQMFCVLGPNKEALHPKKIWSCEHPQLINMNHNMCPYSCINAMLAHILDKCFLKDHIHTICRWSRLPFFWLHSIYYLKFWCLHVQLIFWGDSIVF